MHGAYCRNNHELKIMPCTRILPKLTNLHFQVARVYKEGTGYTVPLSLMLDGARLSLT